MLRPVRNLEDVALFTVIAILFGIVVAKILGHLHLDDTFTQVITIVQVLSAMALCWIEGWKRGTKK